MSVTKIQTALKARGFDPGPIDGIMGPKTEAAIVAFKLSKGLRARPYVGPITARALGVEPPSQPYVQPWMNEAQKHLGLREIPGKAHNPTILKWVRELGGWFTDDETPWCGTFVAHCLRTTGFDVPEHWYRAKAYSHWGAPCPALIGSVAVFARRGGGHVGFTVGQNATDIYVLGGNQRNQVNIAPISRERLLGFRWPEGARRSELAPQMHGGTRTRNEQ